jgi:CO/xanthine dehydrogenase Mo-binding subunit
MTSIEEMTEQLTDSGITRKRFLQSGGVLAVGVALPAALGARSAKAVGPITSLDGTRIASWIEILSDSKIVVRTGRIEIGVGMTATYAQIVAEELDVPFESIHLIMGDTDRTPDGGYSAGLLPGGGGNLRKVAAYTRQALLDLASKKLSVPTSALTVTNGVVKASSGSVSYAELVKGQELQLTIPVAGNLTGFAGLTVTGSPPVKSPSEYKVIGKSYPRPDIVEKVQGKTAWVGDVHIPGLLHARIVRPKSLGSTLVKVDGFGGKKFPTAKVVQKGNLVAVVSPNEWEAIAGAQSLKVKWSDWSGLPGSENLPTALRALKYSPATTGRSKRGDTSAFATAAKKIETTYYQPYVKHAPIGPYIGVADVRSDGLVRVWSHSANPQALRKTIATMLGTPTDNVVVHWLDQSGQYGRTTWGGDGPEADAVILSKELGRPVRVQWTRQEDHGWSTQSPASLTDMKVGLDSGGNIVSFQMDHYMPTSYDVRPLGALLAGLPALAAIQSPTVSPTSSVSTVFGYDKVPNVLESAYGTDTLGADSPSKIGLRGNIMRTPWQRQQNFALESAINEAAAATGQDPIQFRLKHTTDKRLTELLNKTAQAAGWQTRPSPSPKAQASGSKALTGQGVSIMIRGNAYWVGIAEVSVTPSTGAVKVTKFTIGADVGKIINPRGLKRIVEGGLVQGLSEALHEELQFDKSTVTSSDWKSYPILTMAETPKITVVTIDRDDVGFGGGGEPPNALATASVVAAFHDATGKPMRRLPLKPAYVKAALKA